MRVEAWIWLSIPCIAAGQEYTGSRACAGCHRNIYESYMKTGMARSSGVVERAAVPAGEVRRYSMDAGRMRFGAGLIEGEREMAYFIGSGAAARSFLWRAGDALFELPVTWYARGGWGMSPGYEPGQTLQLARPIEVECLNCHSSQVRAKPGFVNRYEWPPAGEAGIGCERCHGSGTRHVAERGRGFIVNPEKLTPARRDDVCAQCHLTGVERVPMAGRDMGTFRPGDDLSAFVTAFLWSEPTANAVHVASHFERLAASGCRKGAGQKMWCGSCHDAHRVTRAEERAQYYRGKCMACHESSEHAIREADCGPCHMPSKPAADAAGASFTDHSIPRRPDTSGRAGGRSELRAFGKEAAPREAGIAWARIAHRSLRQEDFERALALLREAYASGARDGAMLTTLAFLTDRAGDESAAFELYQEAAKNDSLEAEGLVNLGSIYAKRGLLAEAERVWAEATRRSPGLEAAWIKLATVQLATGRRKEAMASVDACLRYHPDSAAARELLH